MLVFHLKRLGYGAERGWPQKDGRVIAVERVLRFKISGGEWVYQDDGDADCDDTHTRCFYLRSILVHFGGVRCAKDSALITCIRVLRSTWLLFVRPHSSRPLALATTSHIDATTITSTNSTAIRIISTRGSGCYAMMPLSRCARASDLLRV